MEAHIRYRRVSEQQHLACLLLGRRIIHDQLDAFVPRQIADDFGVNPRDRFEFSRPVVAMVGPCQPGCGVRLPFGGHAQVERCRGNA
jgi:hypothetical protein